MNISIKFARRFKTLPATYWEIIKWRGDKLSVRDIKALLTRRKIRITYFQCWYWIKKTDNKEIPQKEDNGWTKW